MRACLPLLLLGALTIGRAADIAPPDTARQLAEIRAGIEILQTALTDRRTEAEALQHAITAAERTLREAQSAHERLREALAARNAQLAELGTRRAAVAADLSHQRDKLVRGAREAYFLARQGPLQILLRYDDPVALRRTFSYRGYLLRAAQAKLVSVHERLASLDLIETAIRHEQEALSQLEADAARHAAETEKLKAVHGASLAALRDQLAGDETSLAQLQDDERELTRLLERIAPQPRPEAKPLPAPFPSLQGKLAWPAAGRRTDMPGNAARADDNVDWPGIFIATGADAPVSAISTGQIVFADRFRNLGLLVIIDHGAGYMSLYGHTATLVRHTGDWVETGDVVATMGDAAASAELYFEIRRNGNALDPRDWCLER